MVVTVIYLFCLLATYIFVLKNLFREVFHLLKNLVLRWIQAVDLRIRRAVKSLSNVGIEIIEALGAFLQVISHLLV